MIRQLVFWVRSRDHAFIQRRLDLWTISMRPAMGTDVAKIQNIIWYLVNLLSIYETTSSR
jgi:hypothetical protein